MNIESTIKSLFFKIAKKLNLELVNKTENEIKYSDKGLNPTAIGANVVANIAIDDSDIIIEGDNKRAEALREIKDYYTDEIQNAVAEIALGTGDAIVRPFTDGKNIGLNIISNENFIITKCIGNHLKGVIIKLDEYTTDNKVYRLFESQMLKDNIEPSILNIQRFAFKDDKEISLDSTSWNNIEPEINITANQLLLGRYKCPTLNRKDYNSKNGVPITFGCEDIVENIKNKYNQYNDEFDRKTAKTFADKTLFNSSNNKTSPDATPGNVKGSKIKGQEFILSRSNLNETSISSMIHDYSPAIRETEFREANNFNLSVLELCCGFSRGVFTTPETAFATATEMKNSLKKTFAFVKRFRKRLELGDKMLFNALNIIMNVNVITPLGDWEIRHDWSYDYIEETKERFNQLLQGHSAGVVKDETICAWINNLDEEEAAQYMVELKAAAEPEIIEEEIIDDGITNE